MRSSTPLPTVTASNTQLVYGFSRPASNASSREAHKAGLLASPIQTSAFAAAKVMRVFRPTGKTQKLSRLLWPQNPKRRLEPNIHELRLEDPAPRAVHKTPEVSVRALRRDKPPQELIVLLVGCDPVRKRSSIAKSPLASTYPKSPDASLAAARPSEKLPAEKNWGSIATRPSRPGSRGPAHWGQPYTRAPRRRARVPGRRRAPPTRSRPFWQSPRVRNPHPERETPRPPRCRRRYPWRRPRPSRCRRAPPRPGSQGTRASETPKKRREPRAHADDRKRAHASNDRPARDGTSGRCGFRP